MKNGYTEELLAFVNAEFAAPLGFDPVSAKDDLLTGGLVDSFGVMRIVAHIEDAHGVTVPMGEVTLENFGTVEAISNYLSRLGNSAQIP